MFWLWRERTQGGRTTVEDGYGITSLRRDEASAADLLSLLRGHWGIENSLHYVRDVTMGEDASRVRKKSAPQILAGLRNAALPLLRLLHLSSIAEATRACLFRPQIAVQLVLGQK